MLNYKRISALVMLLGMLLTGLVFARAETLPDQEPVVSEPVERAPEEVDVALSQAQAWANEAPEGEQTEEGQLQAAGVPIDAAHFPDPVFRKWVQLKYDSNGNGSLSSAECAAVTKIVFDSFSEGELEDVSTLKGIGYFEKLTYLDCDMCRCLTDLDVRGLAALKVLKANYLLGKGTLVINASGCAKLETLACNDTYKPVKVILKGCGALKELNFHGSALKALDISDCPALRVLDTTRTENAIKLDISNCPALIRAVRSQKRVNIVDSPDTDIVYHYANKYRVECSVNERVIINGKVVNQPSSIALRQKGTINAKVGKEVALKAVIKPVTAATVLTWKSSNAKVATVSEEGVVMPRSKGKATITVRTANGKTAKVVLKVDIAAPTRVVISQGRRATVTQGEKLSLGATLYPSYAISQMTWTSSDSRVASVSRRGVVTARKPGKAVVTVRTANGKEASCRVTVKRLGSEISFPLYFYRDTDSTETTLKLTMDWSFEGDYYDIQSSAFSFTGRFSSVVAVNEYCYKMQAKAFRPTIFLQQPLMEKGNVWYLYKPETPVSLLPEEVRSEFIWELKTLGEYAMYNETTKAVYRSGWRFD